MRTPLQTRVLAVPAGLTGVRESTPGQHVKIVSCSVATVLLGFDNMSPQRVYQGDCYKGPRDGFQSIRLFDDVGACTVVVQISEEPISGSDGSTATGMLTQLTSINQEISGGVATLQVPDLILPVTPGPGLQVLAANALRTECEIHAPRTNGAGLVYLGITAARSTAVDKFEVLSAGESWFSEREKGAIFACGSTGAEIVVAREC